MKAILTALLIVLVSAACGQESGPTEAAPDVSTSGDQVQLDGFGPEQVSETRTVPVGGCDDQDPCTHGETYDDSGACIGGIAYECDDGRECTTDSCDGMGDCSFALTVGWCLVEGECAQAGAASPGAACLVCDDLNPHAWSLAADGQTCDDGNACTQDDQCLDGACAGANTDCDDGQQCTADSCDPVDGCAYLPLDGAACVLSDSCVKSAFCQDGDCEAVEVMDCNDQNDCTADDCSQEDGCLHTALDGIDCDDKDVCTLDDKCIDDVCLPGPDSVDCNDGNECTDDLCHPDSGCYHQLNDNPCCDEAGVNMCDDGSFCTVDSCDPETGECFYEDGTFACNDYDACTGPDHCQEGSCTGPPVDCYDGNPCTVDLCVSPTGCAYEPLDDIECDDGLECSTGDSCVLGMCVADLAGCACQPQFSPHVNKLTALAIGADGQPGASLDVDLNVETCAPLDNCSAGIDNSLGLLAELAGDALKGAVAGGDVILLLEHREFNASGTPYPLALYIGQPTGPDCDVQTETCDYLVKADSFDADCKPVVLLDNAMVDGATLQAGGPGYNFLLPLPLSADVILEVTLFYAQVQGKVTFAAGGPASLDGILAGAISKEAMLAAIESVDPADLPLDKELVVTMLELMISNDIDTDDNGTLDAASIGLPFAAGQGNIVGTDQ